MSFHFRPSQDFTRIIELTPAMRKQIEATIDHLLSVLDHFDGDENVEDDASGEPWLGWTEMEGRFNTFHPGDDREQEDENDEDGADFEPTLGWSEGGFAGLTFETDERELEGVTV